MISAIVTSLDEEHLTVTPSTEVDLASLVGKKAQYVDKHGKVWPGVVIGYEDPFAIIKFDQFPTSLGQGQLVDIFDGKDENPEEQQGL